MIRFLCVLILLLAGGFASTFATSGNGAAAELAKRDAIIAERDAELTKLRAALMASRLQNVQSDSLLKRANDRMARVQEQARAMLDECK